MPTTGKLLFSGQFNYYLEQKGIRSKLNVSQIHRAGSVSWTQQPDQGARFEELERMTKSDGTHVLTGGPFEAYTPRLLGSYDNCR